MFRSKIFSRLFRSSRLIRASASASASFHSAASGRALIGTGLGLSSLALSLPIFAAGSTPSKPTEIKKNDFVGVKKAIADVLDAPDFDDGSLGPIFVRLAWHASGTFNQFDKSGGSNGGTMRFQPESTDGANAGLGIARAKLDSIKAVAPWISYGDLWTLAGVVAIEEMGGPTINWRPGRVDVSPTDPNIKAKVPSNGRLPNAALNGDHIRAVFYRMGFSDREIVALSGAHALGRCHTDRSGYEGPWTNAPTTFSNEYFKLLFSEKWEPVTLKNGTKQFMNPSRSLMMLPTDLVLRDDGEFKKVAQLYAADEKVFFEDFSKAFSKLLELGLPPASKGWF